MKIQKYFKILSIVVIFLSLALTNSSAFAQKTDTIIHINGNVLLGEIKRLEGGIVNFKMDGMGTIKFQVDKIETFKSEKYFQVTLNSGMQRYCKFDTSNLNRMVKLVLINDTELVNVENIVEMYPIKRNIWLRISGVFSLGFNYSKGSNIANLNSSGNIKYEGRKTIYALDWSQNITFEADSLKSEKSDIGLNFQHLLRRRWYAGLNIDASSNSELGFDLRLLGGATLINYLVQNQNNELYVAAGGTGTREWVPDQAEPTNNLEGIFGAYYHYIKYTDPEIHVKTSAVLYPNITTKGRYRFNYALDAKVEVFNDFHVGLNFYYSFDSKPVNETASKDDYGITTTISYSFH